MDGVCTVGQSLQKSLSRSARSIRGGFLIGLLVDFREEAHVQVIRCRIFTHRDPEFYGPLAVTFIDRVEVQLCKFIRRLCLSEGPFLWRSPNPKSNGIVTRVTFCGFLCLFVGPFPND